MKPLIERTESQDSGTRRHQFQRTLQTTTKTKECQEVAVRQGVRGRRFGGGLREPAHSRARARRVPRVV